MIKIGGFMKLTLLDYPDNVACIIFTQGCNYKCPFCHNSSLIKNDGNDLTDESLVLSYLKKRQGILDGVSISGGEPLIQKDLKAFIKKVKKMGYKVKIDTNGSNPEGLKDLIDNNLIDYVAMDIKNTFTKYDLTTGVKANINKIKESIKIIENSKIKYEFRTTIVKEFHNREDIKEILKLLNNKSLYYIQNFNNNDQVLNKSLHGFSQDELLDIKKELEREYPNIKFRDI